MEMENERHTKESLCEELGEAIRSMTKSNKLVAFIDILGFKSKVENDLEGASILPFIIKRQTDLAKKEIKVFMFSDCVYLVCEKDKFDVLVELISCIQLHLLNGSPKAYGNGSGQRLTDINLIRGAITYGEVLDYNNEKLNILLGKAVNEAYVLESEKAQFPRVILDEKLAKCLQNDNINESSFKKDKDDQYYLDFLEYFHHKGTWKDNEQWIDEKIRYIDEKIAGFKDIKDIKDKLLWFREYLVESKKYTFNSED